MEQNADYERSTCRICGTEIVRIPNPNDPEEWGEEDYEPGLAYNYGCDQAACDRDDGREGWENNVPYPPHEPAQIDSSGHPKTPR